MQYQSSMYYGSNSSTSMIVDKRCEQVTMLALDHRNSTIRSDELDYYLDLAVNECQRWLEAVSRELFIDGDDFLYSLRYGTQLRQVVNRLLPDCFEWTTSVRHHDGSELSALKKKKNEATVNDDDQDWIVHWLEICWRRLGLRPDQLFHPEDLDDDIASINLFDDNNHRHAQISDRLRRTCVTISELATRCCLANPSLPRFDRSAVEPLLDYHSWLHASDRVQLLHHPLDRPNRDVYSALLAIVDRVCWREEDTSCCLDRSVNVDQANTTATGTMIDDDRSNAAVTAKVSRYLAELPSSTIVDNDDLHQSLSDDSPRSSFHTSSVGTKPNSTNNSRCVSPFYRHEYSPTTIRRQNQSQLHIPTRASTKIANEIAHNPLQFISASNLNATSILAEQAKQQIQLSDEQRKKTMAVNRPNVASSSSFATIKDDESEWQSNLHSWRSKRKSAIGGSSKNIVNTESIDLNEKLSTALSSSSVDDYKGDANGKSSTTIDNKVNDNIGDSDNDDDCNKDSKGENILTITSSPVDEHTDSGIENREEEEDQRSTSPGHSASSSSEISPRSDSKLAVNHRYFNSGGKYFLRSPSPIGPPLIPAPSLPPPPPPPPPLSAPPPPPAPFTTTTVTTTTDSSLSSAPVVYSVLERRKELTITTLEFTAVPTEKLRLSNELVDKQRPIELDNRSNQSEKESLSTIPTISTIDTHLVPKEDLCLHTDINLSDHQPKSTAINSLSTAVTLSTTSVELTKPTITMAPIVNGVNVDETDVHSSKAAYQPAANNVTTLLQTKSSSDKKIAMTTTADGRLVFNMDLSGQSYERGFGFSIGGGRDRKMPITIDSVIAGTTADKCGLQVGDQVLSINAESVEDKYHATVNRMIHEAIRLGDIEIVVRRLSGIKTFKGEASPNGGAASSPQSAASFDQKRTLFNSEQKVDTFYQFREQRRRGDPIKWPQRTIPSLPLSTDDNVTTMRQHSSSNSSSGSTSAEESIASEYSDRIRPSDCDYRVSSIHEQQQPGKLADFIPEVERAAAQALQTDEDLLFDARRREIESACANKVTQTAPKLLRNYDFAPIRNENIDENVISSRPTEVIVDHEDEHETEDSVQQTIEKDYSPIPDSREWRNIIEQQRQPSPGQTMNKNHNRLLQVDHKYHASSTTTTATHQLSPGGSSSSSATSPIESSKDTNDVSKRRLPAFGLTEATRVAKLHGGSSTMDPELRYLQMAANNSHQSHQHPPPNKIYDHWMIKEAQLPQRLTDQMRIVESSSANNGINSKPFAKLPSPQPPSLTSSHHQQEDPVVAVSGKHQCSHCQMELGRGAAMIIESLNLFYHLSCFRCYVCNIALGNGVHGADVRVRDTKLHCQSCYSNDDIGLKFSQV